MRILLACRHWPLGFTDQGYYIPAPHNLACLATVCKCICPVWEATVSGKIPGQKIAAKALLFHRPSDKSLRIFGHVLSHPPPTPESDVACDMFSRSGRAIPSSDPSKLNITGPDVSTTQAAGSPCHTPCAVFLATRLPLSWWSLRE